MNITINTDASYHPDYKVGGYAFYIVCNLFKMSKGGYFKMQPKNSEEAEVMCIGNAIATLLAQKELPQVRYLIINSDCMWGMANIEVKDGVYREVRILRDRLVIRMQAEKFEFRHVKAHNGTPDKRSWVNDWCDAEAKKWMRKRVKLIKNVERKARKNLVVT